MATNTLSRKSFDTKTPVVCHPPPMPPYSIPPALKRATFFCFATLKDQHPLYPALVIASCRLRWDNSLMLWYGESSSHYSTSYIQAYLWAYPLQPTYTIHVNFWWPTGHAWGHQWNGAYFSPTRPYIGEPLAYRNEHFKQRATCVVREIPT